MAGRNWAAVYAVLSRAISGSDPYDVEAGIVLLHSMAGNAELGILAGAGAANLHHLAAVIDDGSEGRRIARHSMVSLLPELERLSRHRG